MRPRARRGGGLHGLQQGQKDAMVPQQADARRRQYCSLLVAAEAAASQRIREKEAKASEVGRRRADLEDRVARRRAEASAWQAKALADQSTAAALHAQLQQAAAAAQTRGKAEEEEDNAGAVTDDAGLCFVGPDRVVEIAPPPPPSPPARLCRTCQQVSASVVLLLCRHLCVCADCEPAVPCEGRELPNREGTGEREIGGGEREMTT
ncbi:BOI-related E3 ubiquitin-protein ligase 1-like [Panicum miliaceum]|uniref:BOI-related E3 ubiquitin-protein ligase 1-like n=1 Tax=Panicum miliaceum TaxID=4540 RepID=A0A3L6RBG7_PANMI|nr:BOI-related E3 ubiquitin-protein ligase 1-like [Panicum miliaceum]